MEVYTFVHKETKEIIKVHYLNRDDDFGDIYFLIDRNFGIPWFVHTIEEINYLLEHKKFVHPVNNFENSPTPEFINLDDYEVKKFTMNEDI